MAAASRDPYGGGRQRRAATSVSSRQSPSRKSSQGLKPLWIILDTWDVIAPALSWGFNWSATGLRIRRRNSGGNRLAWGGQPSRFPDRLPSPRNSAVKTNWWFATHWLPDARSGRTRTWFDSVNRWEATAPGRLPRLWTAGFTPSARPGLSIAWRPRPAG